MTLVRAVDQVQSGIFVLGFYSVPMKFVYDGKSSSGPSFTNRRFHCWPPLANRDKAIFVDCGRAISFFYLVPFPV